MNNAGNVVSTPDNKPLEQRPSEMELHHRHQPDRRVALLEARRRQGDAAGETASSSTSARWPAWSARITRLDGTRMGGVTLDYAAAKGGVST